MYELRPAKRVRYAAEAAEPILGRPAARLAKAATRLQTVLGTHHDAVAAEAWLRQECDDPVTDPTGGPPTEVTFEAGMLVAELHRTRAELGERWPEAWEKVRELQRRIGSSEVLDTQ